MKWIDEHPSGGITDCLANAIITLSSKMGTGLSYNFIMVSTCDTLWALCYNKTLSYRRESEQKGYVWEVASEPLSETGWVKASNYYLYVFTTNKATPDSIPVKDTGFGLPENIDKNMTLSFEFPNPSSGNTLNIEIDSKNANTVSFELYNSRGEFLSKTTDITINTGKNHYNYNTGYLRAGIYYIKMEAGKNSQAKKLIVVHSH
jgi:hypothetical protein